MPLGIRAEVCAIYEPPQESSTNSLRLLNDPYQEVADKIAHALGLQKVGWIITDLVAEDRTKGIYDVICRTDNISPLRVLFSRSASDLTLGSSLLVMSELIEISKMDFVNTNRLPVLLNISSWQIVILVSSWLKYGPLVSMVSQFSQYGLST